MLLVSELYFDIYHSIFIFILTTLNRYFNFRFIINSLYFIEIHCIEKPCVKHVVKKLFCIVYTCNKLMFEDANKKASLFSFSLMDLIIALFFWKVKKKFQIDHVHEWIQIMWMKNLQKWKFSYQNHCLFTDHCCGDWQVVCVLLWWQSESVVECPFEEHKWSDPITVLS